MDIGQYSFKSFVAKAEEFHGCAAPGLLLGAYMVEFGRKLLPPGTLFEALCETGKCLPDSVQLLTLCTLGNGRVKVVPGGRFALTLFDKHSFEGFRVWPDLEALRAYPELRAWLMKEKPKAEQDTPLILAQIEAAGESVCRSRPVRVRPEVVRGESMGELALCPDCGEGYPLGQGARCRACQGLARYFQEPESRPGG